MHTTVSDRWLRKDKPIPREVYRRLNAARDPLKADIPDDLKTREYGKGGRWLVMWRTDGRQRKRIFRLRADAEAFAAGLDDTPLPAMAGRHRFRDVVDLWADTLLDIKGSTQARYARDLTLHVLPAFGDTPVEDLDPDRLQRWVATLYRGTAPVPDGVKARPLSAESIRGAVTAVRLVLDYAVKRSMIARNPAVGLRLPRKNTVERKTFLTPDEVRSLAAHAPTGPGAACILTLAATGMRIGEALGLNVGDVDAAARRIHIDRTVTVDRDGRTALGLPKNGKPRTVAYPAWLGPVLAELLDRPASAPLFAAPRGGRWTVNTWRNRVWYPASRASGVEARVHDLRHTYASWAVAAGADVKTLQRQLGHSSASMTLDVYAELFPDRLDEVASLLPDLGNTACNTTAQ